MFKLGIDNMTNIYRNVSNTIASIRLGRFIKDLENSIGKRLLHDTIIMEGFVDIINGDKVIHGKNSVVDQGLAGLINYLAAQSSSNNQFGSYGWSGMTTYMVIGSDTTHGTANGMTTLQTPIGTSPGTRPNIQSGATNNPAPGQWQVQWTSTWNPGTVSGTLGEVGLYLDIQPSLNLTFQSSIAPVPALFSRMASSAPDSKFTAFTINNAVPLSIAWTFRLTFAP